MRIRRLQIRNFRGIKSLDWTLPADQRLVVLVGPGDSGKSTLLDAIHYLLGDRWNIPISDIDFYGGNVDEPISIRAVLIDLPDSLRKDTAFGLWLSGVDDDGELHQDPEDSYSPALIASLSVDSSLEPKWTVERVDGQETMLTVAQRRHFSTFKIDDRTDTQLRWSRTSALGRMSAQDGGERDALAAASRAAQSALASHESSSLADLAQKIQERANAIGGGRFEDIKPGLDTSRSSMGAGLALYESMVPLTSFGLGSRRLASFAVQQLAAGNRAVAVVDEIEDGLEPHRAVRLLNYLLTDDAYSQVVVTTHSPVIVEQAQIENLATVRSVSGTVTVTSLGGASDVLQRVRRSRPSTLLARRVIVAEGKTEHGLLLQMLDYWDEERTTIGLSTSAGEGIAIQDGMGGSEVPLRALALAEIGYEVAGFMDNDVRTSDAAVTSAEAGGVNIFRWDVQHNTESQISFELDAETLTSFIAAGVERRSAHQTVLDDINWTDATSTVSTLDVSDWLSDGMTIEVARERVAKAATGLLHG
ncbi:ATP-binding protein [Chryseoglobus sp. 28M-23]|uniref:ATP-dependent nuclease n=1 Tax=Chryseoglobus sp. 28M-23 TaxID=2772253 RepID=UPI001747105C|nr:ATP-binding protein [Chryseoglobus sp. 28M-23]QOD94084.1 AAA family ATPase [Chryseoglobus sp. 28M-23]